MGQRLERGLQFSKEQAVGVLAYFKRLGSEYLTFVGGEPTIHPDLPEMILAARELGFSRVMIDTNGHYLRPFRRIDPRALHYVRVSLDGATAESHDTVRGQGSFERTLAALEFLVGAGFAVRITYTVFRFNTTELPALVSLASRLGLKVINLHSFSEEGCGRSRRDWALQPHEWIKFCEELKRNFSISPIEIRLPPTWVHREQLASLVDAGFQGCIGCSLDRISVFPDGRCYICPLFLDSPCHFASLTPHGLVVNKAENEYEFFLSAALQASSPDEMGCPAEHLLEGHNEKVERDGLVSICRLWRIPLASWR